MTEPQRKPVLRTNVLARRAKWTLVCRFVQGYHRTHMIQDWRAGLALAKLHDGYLVVWACRVVAPLKSANVSVLT